MKIYIIGSSASGKTSLATHITEALGLAHYNTDYLRYIQKKDERGRVHREESEYKTILMDIASLDDWVFEGQQSLPILLEEADVIIWLKISAITALYRQWKRYLTDSSQRKEHGFFNNLLLSKSIVLEQFCGRYDEKRANDPDYNHINKLRLISRKYSDKIIIAKDWRKINLTDLKK